MTLIVGILCSDGAVVAADGAVTLGNLGEHTVRQAVKKITVIDECVAVAVSGPVGLAQRIIDEVRTLWSEKKAFRGMRTPEEVGPEARKALWNHLKPELEAAAVARTVYGPVAAISATTFTMLALPIKGRIHLIQFDQQGAPEIVTDPPFAAVGSGQAIADPFLAFLRRVFWPGSTVPTLAEGTFAAYWTLMHAVKVHPGGVAEPIQVCQLRNSDCKARELTEAELLEHEEFAGNLEDALRDIRADMAGKTKSTAPPPPEPGKS